MRNTKSALKVQENNYICEIGNMQNSFAEIRDH